MRGFTIEVDGPRARGQDRGVAVGQALGIVIEVLDRGLPQGGQLGVDSADVRLTQGVAGQVDLLKRIRPPEAVLLAAQQEDRADWHKAGGIAGKRVGHRVVIPRDPAHQVRRHGVDVAVRGIDPDVQNQVLIQAGFAGRRLPYGEGGERQALRQGTGPECQTGGGGPIVQDIPHDIRLVRQQARDEKVGALPRHDR